MRRKQTSIRSSAALGGLAVLLWIGLMDDANAAELAVQEVSVTAGATTQVVLALSGIPTGAAVSSFTMSEPDRIVVDIADARVDPKLAEGVTGGLVDRLEVETFDDGQGIITRVRIFLSGPATHAARVQGAQVVVSLTPGQAASDPMASALQGATSGTTAEASTFATPPTTSLREYSGPCLSGSGCDESEMPNGPRVRSIDFKQVDGISRLIIQSNQRISYTVTQPQSDLLVVDLPGVLLPQSLGRTLDTSEFASVVRSVRPLRTGSGTRIAINLRQANADYKVVESGDNFIYVDLPIPSGLQAEMAAARQSAAAVAPAGNQSEGISNAYQSEILISQGGRTSNPQSSFGTGGGSSDPASMLAMASGFSFDQGNASSASYGGRRISLDFVNADVHSIFRLISSVSRLNIVASDDVKGTVTVRMEDVPWDQAFAAILQAKGYGAQRFGNVVRVAPIETIKAEQQSALEAKRAKDELTELDMLVLPLNYAQAADLEPQVKSLLSTRGSVQIDTRGNQLVVRETAERLAQLRELVRHLDKQTPQVLIEARIVEASSSYQRALGIQWGSELNASTATGYSTGLFFPNSVGVSGGLTQSGASTFYSQGQDTLLVDLGVDSAAGALAMSLGSIPGLIDLDARLSALESDGMGKVISTPRVTTLDNQEARISQGTKVPYLSSSSGGTNVQFIKAELELLVTPHITSDNKVFLDITITNNRADFSQTVNGQPAIQTKEAQTQLLVANGDTSVLGGVFSTEEAVNISRVPGFSQIPLIGNLFKSTSDTKTRNELLVFITPRIVTASVTDAG
jgi:type IV pilus assembly protein PilQ